MVVLAVAGATCLGLGCWLMWGGTLEMGPHWNPHLTLRHWVQHPYPVPEGIFRRVEHLARLRELMAAAFGAGGLAALGVAAFLGVRLRRR
jgi:hypothetical protein